jgi:2-oxoacid:acceptor oxidoreductase delta subunit (pyruvate/2-ketoisovalerate family)
MVTKSCMHICGESSPGIGEAGKTGEWRTSRPVIDPRKCIPAKRGKPSCFICWLYCPEALISKTIPVQVNLDYCKGCGICMQVCPAQAISMENEGEFCSEQDGLNRS